MRLEDDRFYSVNDLIQLMGLSQRIVLRLLATGDIPGVKYGKKWKVLGSDLRQAYESLKAST